MQTPERPDTICAVSTPLGEGGVGIIRISGPEAISITDPVFRGAASVPLSRVPTHTLHYGQIVDPATGELLDKVLVGVMHAPRSYTKETVVEINAHGGSVVLRRVLDLMIRRGARLAEPGEFTRRAFLNGRMDLTQAEAVMDLIRSKTDASCRAAIKRLEGALGQEIRAARERLSRLLVQLEAAIDFPEDDLELFPRSRATEEIQGIMGEVQRLIDTGEQGRILQDGLATVIIGRPNVGKSSLLNQLLQQDRAIVNPAPGTTRDLLEGYINSKGVPLRIIDTAGLRDTTDPIEQEGVRRTEAAAAEADLILFIIDASLGFVKEEEDILTGAVDGKKVILVINKMDIAPSAGRAILRQMNGRFPTACISATKGEGIEELKATIVNVASAASLDGEGGVLVAGARHKAALLSARDSLGQALSSIKTGMPEDIITVDVRAGLDRLGEIIGDTTTEDILDRIFKTFCIGK